MSEQQAGAGDVLRRLVDAEMAAYSDAAYAEHGSARDQMERFAADVWAAAVTAERERCAAIARRVADGCTDCDAHYIMALIEQPNPAPERATSEDQMSDNPPIYNSVPAFPDELAFVDEDIREALKGCAYPPGLPTQMQMARNLRELRDSTDSMRHELAEALSEFRRKV